MIHLFQALENTYLRLLFSNQTGEPGLLVEPLNPRRSHTRDDIIHTFDGGHFQIVEETIRNWQYRCHPISVSDWVPKLGQDLEDLPWSLAGVNIFNYIDETVSVLIDKDEIRGKSIIMGQFINDWRTAWICSKYD